MEAIKKITEAALNPTSQLSNSRQNISKASTALREITKDEEIGLFAIINQTRALQGWSLLPAVELEPICNIWWMEFSRFKIPPTHYQTLFQRAHDARIRHITQYGTKNAPAIDATHLIALWTGENGLASEIRRKEIATGRFLPSTAESDCDRCFGSGYETVPGKGARPCGHSRIAT